MDIDKEQHFDMKLSLSPTLKRATVSSLCLSSMSIQDDDSDAKNTVRYSKLTSDSLPSLASITDDESSRTDSPSPSLQRSETGGWGTAETRRAYADLTALASASPMLSPPTIVAQPTGSNQNLIPAPFLPEAAAHTELMPDLSWGQFLQEEFDDDQDAMSF